MAGGFTIGFKQPFTSQSSVTVTHNLGREDLYTKAVIGDITRNDLLVSVVPSASDPTNVCVVTLSSSQTGVIQILLADTLPVSLPTSIKASPGGRDVQVADSTSDQTTTASGGTWDDIAGATLTTKAGATRSYQCVFTGEVAVSNKNRRVLVRIMIDGVAQASTVREVQPPKADAPTSIATNHAGVVGPGIVVKMQWQVTNGTGTLREGSLSIMGAA
jgi:hypothetical protein